MNPNHDTVSGGTVPQQMPMPASGADQTAAAPLPPVGSPTLPSPPASQPPVADQSSASQVVTPSVAADGDRIELEWVLKAKQIVAATQEDPYQQNRQLAALKADYLRKRYNKTVKVSE